MNVSRLVLRFSATGLGVKPDSGGSCSDASGLSAFRGSAQGLSGARLLRGKSSERRVRCGGRMRRSGLAESGQMR